MASDPADDRLPSDLAAAAALSQALASRLCHDLVSPIGAVSNGADLLREFGASREGEEIEMIGQSAERAAGLLEAFRLAFGAAAADAAPVARPALAGTLGRVLASRRIAFETDWQEGPPLSRREARLAALMAMAGRGLLGMRGGLALDLGPDGLPPAALAVSGQVEADRVSALRHHLATPAALPEPSRVEFALLAPAAAVVGGRITVEEAGEGLVIAVHPA
jgi:histidine phosphotransferase ChpT